MRAAVFAYSRQGCRTARRVLDFFAGEDVSAYTMEKYAQDGFAPLGKPAQAFYGELFRTVDAMIFVGAVGIAVREIAPHVRDKRTDPAVIGIDELGHFVVPLLSGHIGGANALAQVLADELGAVPVVTTATDINRRFSVDAWAARQGFAISSMYAAKLVSAAILERDVPLKSDFPVVTELPPGVIAGEEGELGIYLTCTADAPFAQTLRLVPPVLHLGLGCRRDTPRERIAELVEEVLRENRIDRRAVKCAASIDLKADERGLLDFCEENGWPVKFYSAEELLAVPGDFVVSEFVRSVTGVDNVCERAALLGAERIVVHKTARNGVTVALAAEPLTIKFT
ncbi:MAG: cobalamin biosynthesis protein [Oscillospiraceae bacterium]|nr:cobalamin biosynthesis protein [Oscillospiraceae bacterium]